MGALCCAGSLLGCTAEIKPFDESRFQGNTGGSGGSGGTGTASAGSGGTSTGGVSPGGAGGASAGTGGTAQGASAGTGGASSAGSGGKGGAPGSGKAGGGNEGGEGGSDEPGPAGPPGTIALGDDGTLQIFPVGDSITLGVSGGYRNDLYRKLTDAGYEVDMVGTQYDTSTEIDDKDHEGHGGFTIANARRDIDGWLESIATPDVVLVMLGTNDEAWWTNIYPEGTKDQMVEFVDHLREKVPNAVLIVATIPPQSSANVEPIDMDRAEMTRQYNALMKAALQQHPDHGDKVFVADVNSVLTLSDLYDGIHPSRAAHVKIADVFYDVMIDLLPEPP